MNYLLEDQREIRNKVIVNDHFAISYLNDIPMYVNSRANTVNFVVEMPYGARHSLQLDLGTGG